MSPSAISLLSLEYYETYRTHFMDLGLWEPFVYQVCQRHRLHPCTAIRPGLAGTFPTFTIANRWVVKFFGRLYGGEESYLSELNADWLISTQPAIPAPAMIGTGFLFDEGHAWRWPYLIFEFVPGVSIGEVYEQICYEDKLDLAKQLGQITNQLHSLSLTEIPFFADKDWESYADFLAGQRRICLDNHRKWGSLSEPLIAQIEDYLLPIETIIDGQKLPSLIHADVTRDHLLGRISEGRWQTQALIDFGDTRIGDIFYELPALHLDTFQGDRQLLKAFLEAYGLSDHQKQAFTHKAMSVALLHQFDVFFGLRTSLIESACSLEDLANRLF